MSNLRSIIFVVYSLQNLAVSWIHYSCYPSVHHLYTLSTADDLIQSVLASPSEVPIDAYMDVIAFWLPSTDPLKNLYVHLRSCLYAVF